jgi:dTDP-4-dehydrorhamnose reductase
MKSPQILLLGKNGQVGWELQRTLAPLGRIVAVGSREVNFTDPDSLTRLVLDIKPAIIINAAAYTAVNRAESEPELAHKINAVAPGVLAETANQIGAWLVHFSTDYVFNGEKRSAYVETDKTDPLGAYGRSKLAGDLAVQTSCAKHLIFRLCWVYGARGQNFMLTMMRLAKERERLRVVMDQVGCPTWSRMIAEAATHAVRQSTTSRDGADLSGVYHLAATGEASWHDFAEAIVSHMPAAGKKCTTVEAITTAEYPTPARRPAYSVLNCDKLDSTFGLRLPHWQNGLDMAIGGAV